MIGPYFQDFNMLRKFIDAFDDWFCFHFHPRPLRFWGTYTCRDCFKVRSVGWFK